MVQTVDEYVEGSAKDIIELLKEEKITGNKRESYIDVWSAEIGDFIGGEIADKVRCLMEE